MLGISPLDHLHPHRTAFVDEVRTFLAAVSTADRPDVLFQELAPQVRELTQKLGMQEDPVPFFWGATASLSDAGSAGRLGEAWSRFNPMVPRMSLEIDAEERTARGSFRGSIVQCGPPGMVHGGVSALVIDQVMGTLLAAVDRPSFTKRLTVSYLRPTPLQADIQILGGVEAAEGRHTRAWVELSRAGDVTVRAEGEFVLVRRHAGRDGRAGHAGRNM